MDENDIAKKLEGLQTVDTVAKKLGLSRRSSINMLWKLRKKGLVDTGYGKRKIRIYRIRAIKKPAIGYKGLQEVINENSRVKIFSRSIHRIHGHKLTVEEAIVRAIKEGDFRTVLAALGLFNKVKNWKRLLYYAKTENTTRKVGALYDAARSAIKVRRMDERTRKALI